MERRIGSFQASAADGSIFTIEVYVKEIDYTTNQGRETSLGKVHRFETDDGLVVNMLGSGRLKILHSLGTIEVLTNHPGAQ